MRQVHVTPQSQSVFLFSSLLSLVSLSASILLLFSTFCTSSLSLSAFWARQVYFSCHRLELKGSGRWSIYILIFFLFFFCCCCWCCESKGRLTLLHDVQMLPEDVSHEGRRSGKKGLFAQRTHLFALHRKVGLIDSLQRELSYRPIKPVLNIALSPLTWICRREKEERRRSRNIIERMARAEDEHAF